MILMGCSPVRKVKQPQQEPLYIYFPTSFLPDSHVPTLWEEIKSEWSAHHQGRSLASLEKEVDQGYQIFDFGRISKTINKHGVIEQQEVLEFAYAHEEYYPLLVKHGFPVPFFMSDFNPATQKDAKIKAAVIAEVKRIRAKYEAEPIAAAKGTDQYKKELATRIRDGLLHYRHSAKGDCASTLPDWEAIASTCGTCMEFSAILFFAYKCADLDTRFMAMNRTDGSVTSMDLFFNNDTTDTHSLVGVPLSDGTWYYGDLAIPLDGIQNVYTKGVAITPRHFAEEYLNMQMKAGAPFDNLDVALRAKDISPESISDWAMVIDATRTAYGRLSNGEFERLLAEMKVHFGATPLTAYVETVERELHKGNSIPNEATMNGLTRLDEGDPEAGALVRNLFASAAYYGLPNIPRPLLFEEIRPAVERDPYLYASLSILNKTAMETRNQREILDMYRSLHRLHPEHHMIRQLLGGGGLSGLADGTCEWSRECVGVILGEH